GELWKDLGHGDHGQKVLARKDRVKPSRDYAALLPNALQVKLRLFPVCLLELLVEDHRNREEYRHHQCQFGTQRHVPDASVTASRSSSRPFLGRYGEGGVPVPCFRRSLGFVMPDLACTAGVGGRPA